MLRNEARHSEKTVILLHMVLCLIQFQVNASFNAHQEDAYQYLRRKRLVDRCADPLVLPSRVQIVIYYGYLVEYDGVVRCLKHTELDLR